jgi:hypothetical protein
LIVQHFVDQLSSDEKNQLQQDRIATVAVKAKPSGRSSITPNLGG